MQIVHRTCPWDVEIKNTYLVQVVEGRGKNDVLLIADIEELENNYRIEDYSHWKLDSSLPITNAVLKSRDEHAGGIYLGDLYPNYSMPYESLCSNYSDITAYIMVTSAETLNNILPLLTRGYYIIHEVSEGVKTL